MKCSNIVFFRKIIATIIHMHLEECSKEDDPMFKEALSLATKDIDWFFKIAGFTLDEVKIIEKMKSDKILDKCFDKQFHFIAFSIELIDKFVANGLNDNVKVFKRRTLSRFTLYKNRLRLSEKNLNKKQYKRWKNDEAEAKKIAKCVWEKHKEVICR